MARGRGSKEEGEEGRRRASKEAQLARDGGRLREALVEASLKVGELSSSNPFTISFLLRAKGGSVRVRNSKREQGGDAHWRTSPRGSPTPCLQPGRRAHDSDSSQSSSLSQSIRGCCRGKLFGRARCSQRKGSSVCQLRTSWHPAPPQPTVNPFRPSSPWRLSAQAHPSSSPGCCQPILSHLGAGPTLLEASRRGPSASARLRPNLSSAATSPSPGDARRPTPVRSYMGSYPYRSGCSSS
jgi:hypothetical protein